jgi:hypothetical protein
MMKGQQMSGSNCALCDIEITLDNDSRAHIVPEAIGGRRWVRGFLCRVCNSLAGEKWDAIAAKQLNYLCLLFAIERQDGTVPAGDFETQSGQAVRIHRDGHLSLPDTRPEITESGSTAQIKARRHTKPEARKLLLGMKRRYPKLDVDVAMGTVVEDRSYLSEPVRANFNFGGVQSGRCVVMSALALAVASGIKAQACEKATSYLRNNDGEPCFGYFYRRDPVTSRPTNRVFHCVAIKGDSSSRRLVGYVELFGVYRMVACLSDRYTGNPLFNYYAIDPSSGQELDLDLDLSLSEEEVRCACSNEEDYTANMVEAFQKALAIGQSMSFAREQRKVVKQAWKKCITKLGFSSGQILTREEVMALSKCITTEMLPFLTHLVSNGRRVK